MSLPIIVTHPSPLLHKGLRKLLVKSRFRPLRIATTLTADLEMYLRSLESAVWLIGIDRSPAATNALMREVVTANPRVKAVIMAGSQKPEDIVAALKAGACGYVCHDVGGETLLHTLELIAHGEMIVHPQLVSSEKKHVNCRIAENDEDAAYLPTIGRPVLTPPSQPGPAFAGAKLDSDESRDVPSLSRREMLILRMLVHGASNKVIARDLVITEFDR